MDEAIKIELLAAWLARVHIYNYEQRVPQAARLLQIVRALDKEYHRDAKGRFTKPNIQELEGKDG